MMKNAGCSGSCNLANLRCKIFTKASTDTKVVLNFHTTLAASTEVTYLIGDVGLKSGTTK